MPPHRRLPPHRGIRGRCVRRAGAAPRGGGSAAARRGGGRRRRGAGRDSDSCVRDGGARGGLQRHRGSVTCRCLLVVSVSFPCPHGPSIRPQQSHVPSASRPSKSFGITSLERHGTCISRPFNVTSLWHHVPSASRPFGVTSLRRHVPSVSRPFGITSLRRHVPSVSRPFGITSLRRHVPWASRPLGVTSVDFRTLRVTADGCWATTCDRVGLTRMMGGPAQVCEV